jgi:hypothetical protein
METSDDPERRSDSAKARATRARRLAASLEERAESMHRAAAAAQTNVAAFAEMVRESEPEIASRIDVDPERYRTRAAQETARADDARRRREEDEHPERGGRQEPKAQEGREGREPEGDSEAVES